MQYLFRCSTYIRVFNVCHNVFQNSSAAVESKGVCSWKRIYKICSTYIKVFNFIFMCSYNNNWSNSVVFVRGKGLYWTSPKTHSIWSQQINIGGVKRFWVNMTPSFDIILTSNSFLNLKLYFPKLLASFLWNCEILRILKNRQFRCRWDALK